MKRFFPAASLVLLLCTPTARSEDCQLVRIVSEMVPLLGSASGDPDPNESLHQNDVVCRNPIPVSGTYYLYKASVPGKRYVATYEDFRVIHSSVQPANTRTGDPERADSRSASNVAGTSDLTDLKKSGMCGERSTDCTTTDVADIRTLAGGAVIGNMDPFPVNQTNAQETASSGYGSTGRYLAFYPSEADSVADIPLTSFGSFIGHKPSEPVSYANLENLHSAAKLAESQAGAELIQNAVLRRQVVENAARSDQKTLEEQYANINKENANSRFNRSAANLAQLVSDLEAPGTDMTPSQRLWFRNIADNALSKAREAARLTGGSTATSSEILQPFGPAAAGSPSQLSRALAQLFNGAGIPNAPTSQDALASRYAMWAGLNPDEQAALRLNLSEPVSKKGAKQKLNILHNGYILGGGKTALDCSSFVSGLLPNRAAGPGRLTTLDLLAIYNFRRTGHLPRTSEYKAERGAQIKRLSQGFRVVNPRAGDRLLPGDILFFRFLDQSTGHVLLLKSINQETRIATVIEAAQSAGTVREREFPLVLGHSPRNPIRPGLLALRLLKTDSPTCRYEAPKAKGI